MFQALVMLALVAAVSTTPSAPADVLATLDPHHPRLMLKDDDLARLKTQCAQDEVLQKIVRDVLARADECCRKPPLKYEKVGPRLLRVSRDCLDRTYALALAWRWTGDEKYAQKAAENLLTVCAFPDWNPSHFLDTAEMSNAVGIGYDWLYGWLSEDAREKIRQGLIRNGLKPGVEAYTGVGAKLTYGWWAKSPINWNQVCNGGLLVGALSIAETDPEYARTIVPAAISSLPRALATYGPDGAWPEGLGYWQYATTYTAYALSALESALGTDFGLSDARGLSETGFFPIYAEGPTRFFFNFADAGDFSRRDPMPCLFWLARRYRNATLAQSEFASLAEQRASALHLVWYVPRPREKAAELPLDRSFDGPVQVAFFRSAWQDPEALWLGVKAGYNQVNHGHLDLGSFEMDALGVRWARDLGSDNYDLFGYWDGRKGGARWQYYRLRSLSHNVLLLDGKDQDPLAKAKFLKVGKGDSPFVVMDLTSAYAPMAAKVTRGLTLVQSRRAVLVQDELDLPEAHDVAWGMTTDAEIKVAGNEALLTLRGKELKAQILSPAGAGFSVESAEQKLPEKPNKGVKRLVVRLDKQVGTLRVAVLFSPSWKDSAIAEPPKLTALDQW